MENIFIFLKLFFKFEKWTKINVQFSFFKKSFKSFFFIFFCFYFEAQNVEIISMLHNAITLEKMVQSIRKIAIFRIFF